MLVNLIHTLCHLDLPSLENIIFYIEIYIVLYMDFVEFYHQHINRLMFGIKYSYKSQTSRHETTGIFGFGRSWGPLELV